MNKKTIRETVEELPPTAEEVFEQRKAEIDAAFSESHFITRLRIIIGGLRKPHTSRAHKLARFELQRLMAPFLPLLILMLCIGSLFVVTQVRPKEKVEVEIIRLTPDEDLPKLVDPPAPEPNPDPDPSDNDDLIKKLDDRIKPSIDPIPEPEPVPSPPQPTPPPAPTPKPIPVAPNVKTIKIDPAKGLLNGRTADAIRRLTGGRAGEGKGNKAAQCYGDVHTEATVMKVLRWLKKTQKPSGNWEGTIANTALAVLTYLAHGETQASKEFGETVEKGMQYLINSQIEKNGVVTFRGVDGNEYATLICTYALCEAYAMTKNPNLKDVAMKALQRIVNNQSPTGGFDYGINKSSTRDDMSFEGWALQALKAGKMAGLHPEGIDTCIKKAIRCLKMRNFKNGGFNYVAGGAPTGLTATGCLCMQLLGFSDEKEVTEALETMREWTPVFESKAGLKAGGPTPGAAPQYYCYYAAQAKYQAGMREGARPADLMRWQKWNAAMKALYPQTITTLSEKIKGPDGREHEMGYWEKGYNDKTMGTCLCALQLMVYYRYLPENEAIVKAKNKAKPVKPAPNRPRSSVEIDVDI